MNAKTCPKCGKVSFSANTFSAWICPYCNHDLSNLPLEPASEPKKNTPSKEDDNVISLMP